VTGLRRVGLPPATARPILYRSPASRQQSGQSCGSDAVDDTLSSCQMLWSGIVASSITYSPRRLLSEQAAEGAGYAKSFLHHAGRETGEATVPEAVEEVVAAGRSAQRSSGVWATTFRAVRGVGNPDQGRSRRRSISRAPFSADVFRRFRTARQLSTARHRGQVPRKGFGDARLAGDAGRPRTK